MSLKLKETDYLRFGENFIYRTKDADGNCFGYKVGRIQFLGKKLLNILTY